MNKEHQKIDKKPGPTNLEYLLENVQLFIYLFNKKKFEKLLEQREQNHEINLLKDVPKKLNAKAYTMIIKEDEALNKWPKEQLKVELIVKSSS